MNIAILTEVYLPQIASVSVLLSELAQELKKKHHNVTILTFLPNDRLIDKSNESEPFIQIDEVPVYRVKGKPVYVESFILRGLNTVINSRIIYKQSKKILKGKSIDKLLVYSPPLNLCNTARLLAKKIKCEYAIILRDLFPQNAIDLGVIRNRFIIRYYQYIENKVYKNAKMVFPQSEANKQWIERKYKIDKDKLKVVYNWFDNELANREQIIDYKIKFGLDGKKICLYAGTIGPSQNLAFIVDVAEKINDDSIVFLIVGDGNKKEELKKVVSTRAVKNIVFKDYVEPNDFFDLLKSVDIGIISLSSKNKTPIVPGKLSTYMAVGLPIVARINKESTDVIRILDQSRAGLSVTNESVELFVSAIRTMLYDNEAINEAKLGGRDYARNQFSVKYITERILKYL